jgi:NADH:ubiquinone oxidoreductase subunit F (NADH-binding)
MTALLDRPLETSLWTIGGPRLLAGLAAGHRLALAAHLATHGPLAPAERLLGYLDAAPIAGRGGAGFPLAAKLRALPREGGMGRARHVIVNGSESEPASAKDRTLLRRNPHLVLDGAIATAQATGAHRITVAVHDAEAASSVRSALGERRDARPVEVQVLPGGFVAGEARAVLRALRGGPARPPGRRTPPTAEGVLIANAETFAQAALLLRFGPQRFAETGTRDEPGTTLLTVGGAVGRPGVVEIPLGTPLGIVLAAAGAPVAPQAVVLGGYHGSWVAPIPEIRLSRAGAASAGASFGAGVVLVLDGETCALGELARVAGWLAAQSAGQCGPCRFGLPALAADVGALVAGHPAAGAAFAHAHLVTGRGACAHPDGAARFVSSGLHLLQDEVERHRDGGCGRPVLGQLPTGGAQ